MTRIYETVDPKAITWVDEVLDPFVSRLVISHTLPHALLHYCAADFPRSQTHRLIYYAIEDHDGRRIRRPLTFPDGNRNVVVHPISDAELANFSNLYGQILSQFASQQSSPLYMARHFHAEDTLPEDHSLILLAYIYFGANLKHPWT